MTKIFVFKKNDIIWAYQIKGHSHFAEEGLDIVCSAVSVASQMALCGLTEVLGLKVNSEIHDGFLRVELLEEDFANENAQILLKTMEKTLMDISKNYDQFVKLEVRKDVY